jgi:FkbM family methyltransferase
MIMGNKEIVTVMGKNEYGIYCIPQESMHRPAAQAILRGSTYEPETIQFILDNMGTGDVVHAGAYFGDFLPALSKQAFPTSRIWAFEPNPTNFHCAEDTIEINGLGNVIMMNTALGASPGYAMLETKDGHGVPFGGASRISKTGNQEVYVDALDNIVDNHANVSIIHLDVEGYELEALKGAMKIIKKSLPILILEVWATSEIESDWFKWEIKSLGYTISRKIHGNTVYQVQTKESKMAKNKALSAAAVALNIGGVRHIRVHIAGDKVRWMRFERNIRFVENTDAALIAGFEKELKKLEPAEEVKEISKITEEVKATSEIVAPPEDEDIEEVEDLENDEDEAEELPEDEEEEAED